MIKGPEAVPTHHQKKPERNRSVEMPTDAVAQWQQTLSDLQRKRDTVQAQIEALKAEKRPIALSAQLSGGEAQATLRDLNRQLVGKLQELDDIDEAINQASGRLRDAEQEKARTAEVERLTSLATLAENRIALATKIENQIKDLATKQADFATAGRAMANLLRLPADEALARRLNATGRLELVASYHLGEHMPSLALARNPLDPRKGASLAELEQAELGPFVLTEGGIAARAARFTA
jgi:chromosome segregation ATPase